MLLAAGRVCHCLMSPPNTVSSYLTLFTLTDHRQTGSGGFVSVVLSLSLRTVAVSDYHTLCCPDFPLAKQATVFQAPSHFTINPFNCPPPTPHNSPTTLDTQPPTPNPQPLPYSPNCSSTTSFAFRSATMFCSRATCTKAYASNFPKSSCTSS